MHPNEAVINDYIDGTLAAADRASVEAHLAGCEACRGLADDLRRVTDAARGLPPIEPPAGVWRRLAPAIEQAQQARAAGQATRRWTAPYWLAAAAVLVIAAAVGLRVGLPGRRPPATPPAAAVAPAPGGDPAVGVEAELRAAEEHYDKAIQGLEQLASANQGALDPATASTLQKNLAVIDQAISESRAAVRAQPTSEPAQQSLLQNFRTKVAVLQDTVALINEMRKGNEAGAARIVSGLKQKGE